MELDDLKTTWKSIGLDINRVSMNNDDILPKKKNDVKTSLINRFLFEIAVLFIAICLLSTSRLWAPIPMPLWWICSFCLLFAFGIIYSMILLRRIKRINLGNTSHYRIMDIIFSIKKFYRNFEIYGCIIVTILMVLGIIFAPIPYNTAEIIYTIIITACCFLLEYLWYKSNIKKFNKIQNWLE